MTQLGLEYAPRASVRRADRQAQTIQERFDAFHVENPQVFAELLRLARARVSRGERRIGVKALWEELRQALRVRASGEFKLNNSYTALYARMLVETEPALADAIELRRRKAA